MHRGLLWIGLLLVLAGCQQPHTPAVARAPGPPEGPMTHQLKTAGDALLAKGEYAAAALKYQQAVNQEPADLSLRFALGTALSYLERREDTAQQFQWVVSRGKPESQEVQAARRWLLSAGYPVDTRSAYAARSEPGAASGAGGRTAKVKGRMDWPGVDPRDLTIPVRITLTGDELQNRDVKISRRFRLGRPYELWNVPAGKFRLIAQVSDTVLWDQPVTVEAGRDTILDLTSASSPVSPKDFPGSVRIEE